MPSSGRERGEREADDLRGRSREREKPRKKKKSTRERRMERERPARVSWKRPSSKDPPGICCCCTDGRTDRTNERTADRPYKQRISSSVYSLYIVARAWTAHARACARARARDDIARIIQTSELANDRALIYTKCVYSCRAFRDVNWTVISKLPILLDFHHATRYT